MADAVDRYLGLPLSDLPGMLAPSGHHDSAIHGPVAWPPRAAAPTATQEV